MRSLPVACRLALAACLLPLPACSSDSPDAAPEPDRAGALVGTYRTPAITVERMSQVARRAGYDAKDVDEYLSSEFGDAHSVVMTLELTADRWVAFMTIEDGLPEDVWSGPYEIVDDSTVVAGAPPCGPITYDYRIDGDELVLEMTDNDCVDPDGTVPAGELIAQTTLYQSARYTRIG